MFHSWVSDAFSVISMLLYLIGVILVFCKFGVWMFNKNDKEVLDFILNILLEHEKTIDVIARKIDNLMAARAVAGVKE